jgi:predicted PurR-regulated permease PerM
MSVEPERPRQRFKLGVRDAAPLADTATFWRLMAQAATIGMFVLAFGVFLYLTRDLLLPVLAAITVGMTAGPVASWLERRGLSSWFTATATVLLLFAAIYVAAVSLTGPATELMGRAPEIGMALREKVRFLERPFAALRELQGAMPSTPTETSVVVTAGPTDIVGGVIALVTPAVVQLLLFFVTLFFFMLNRTEFRRYLVNTFATRDGRLRTLRTLNDIEQNLSDYLITVTCINFGLGVVIAAGMWLMGLPTPLLWGAMAFAFNYVPYIGPAILHIILLGMGLVTFPTLPGALMPAAFSLVANVVESELITPNILGRRLAVAPLVVFLTVAFWAWLWGPVGAFLAMPILIATLVTLNHLYPDTTLPG